MAVYYPDVLGDLVDARKRFEVDGVQYVERLSPRVIPPGGSTHIRFWLANCWEADASLHIVVSWPRGVAFRVLDAGLDVPLRPAEVAELILPVQAGSDLPARDYRLSVRLGARPEVRCRRVRGQESPGTLEGSLLPYTVGLGLASSIGVGYSATRRRHFEMPLRVEVEADTSHPDQGVQDREDLTPTLISRWVLDDWPSQGRAQKWVNDRRPYILPGLELPILFRVLMDETDERFGRAGLALEIGEALFVSKMLAWTVRYFLEHPAWQDGLLVPAYVLAFQYDLPTDDPTLLVARADYPRLVRLACALTFGLLRRKLGRDVWEMEEQRAVGEFVSQRLEASQPLSAEFLYLPLIVGGLLVNQELTLPGENLGESYVLLASARQKREAALSENPELGALLDKLLPASA
jgi:hypothetical protein